MYHNRTLMSKPFRFKFRSSAIKKSLFSADIVYFCNINTVVFVIEKQCVFLEVTNKFLKCYVGKI